MNYVNNFLVFGAEVIVRKGNVGEVAVVSEVVVVGEVVFIGEVDRCIFQYIAHIID